MALRLRLESPESIYHVINRGNYLADVFRSEAARGDHWICKRRVRPFG